jgi:hypothetical protein
MELEQAVVELELLRAEELRAHNGEESALTEALALAVYVMRGSPSVVLGSPVRAFVDECCQLGPGLQVEAGELYREWASWATAQGRTHPGTAQILGRNLRAAFPGIGMARPRTAGGHQVRTYQGIAVNQKGSTRD